jgi:uncharacterized protein (DUF433 family)
MVAYTACQEAILMALKITAEEVPLRTDEHGTVRVGGTRVTLEVVVARFEQGDRPEEIVDGFPTLQVADVYLVLGYYLRHRAEVDEYIREQDRAGEEIRRRIESDPQQRAFRERLVAQCEALRRKV